MKRIRLYIVLYVSASMLLDVAYRTLDRLARGHPSEWQRIFIEQFTGWYGGLVLLPLIFWAARRFRFRFSFSGILPHAGVLLFFSVIHTTWNWTTRLVVFKVLGMGWYDYGLMRLRYFMEFPADVIDYGLWLGAFYVYQDWLRSKTLEAQLADARLESLTRQLQPHFLFNALNTISSVMYEDLPRAEQMIERLSDFLRTTLRLPESQLVPVSTELALTRQYLEVMRARFEDRMEFEIRCDPLLETATLPALLLQPLVENAVEHGMDPASGRLRIGIDIARDAKALAISIRDHGPGPNGRSNGNGLTNARQRLRTVYGDAAGLRLDRHPQGGAVVSIRIPA